MRRFILVLAALCSIMVRAEGYGEVLWWELDDPSNIKDDVSGVTAESLDVNAARIRYESDGVTGGYLPIYATDYEGAVWPTTGNGAAAKLPGEWFSSIENASSLKFVIELGNWTDGKWVSTSMESEAVSYTYLKDEQHIAEWRDTIPAYATPWTPTSFSVVPEPSSGVLLLVASAMLALRRRKMRENG